MKNKIIVQTFIHSEKSCLFQTSQTILHLQEQNSVLAEKLENHLRKNLQIADDYKRTIIDNQKETESQTKELKAVRDEKDNLLNQYNQLALWAQDATNQLVNRETQIRQLQHEIEGLKSGRIQSGDRSVSSNSDEISAIKKNLDYVQDQYQRSLREIEELKRYLQENV